MPFFTGTRVTSYGSEISHEILDVLSGLLAAPGRTYRITPLTGSYHREAYLAQNDVGESVVMKIRSDPRPLVRSSLVLSLLRRRQLTQQWVVIPPTRTPLGWVLGLRWVPGAALTHVDLQAWTETEVSRLGSDLGCLMSAIHTVRPRNQQWLGKADARFADKLQAGSEHLGTGLTKELKAFWSEIRPALQAAPMALIHRDIHPANIIVHDRGLADIIDYEQSRFADPLYDFVKPFEYVMPLHPAIGSSLVQSYDLDLTRTDIIQRLSAVFALEYLSAIVYFDKRADEQMISRQRANLVTLLDKTLTHFSVTP
jgi:serine/threonine protein kinase